MKTSNIQRLEGMNRELEQHVEDVEEKVELANTQVMSHSTSFFKIDRVDFRDAAAVA